MIATFSLLLGAPPCTSQQVLPSEVEENLTLSISRETYSSVGGEIPSDLLPLLSSGLVEFKANRNLIETGYSQPDSNQILSGVSELFNQWGSYSEDFNLVKLNNNAPKWKVSGEYSRIHPFKFEDKKLSDQFFRERISLKSPSQLAGYAFLTFRFLSTAEDLLWVYSPFIKRDRQVLPSLRSDPIFFSDIAPDDLFSWSGRRQDVDVRIEKTSNLIIPIRKTDIVADLGCKESSFSKPLEAIQWNYKNWPLQQRAGWLPVNFVFSLRPTAILNLISKDPYSSYSRQTLYVDLETSLPVIKAVYGKDGKPWKVVFALYDLAIDSKEGLVKLHRATVSYDALQNAASIWEATKQRGCKVSESLEAIKTFDPTYLNRDGPI